MGEVLAHGHRTAGVASYRLTFGASLIGASLNAVFGFIVAWTLVRYRFPGRRLLDALVDLPFALPTAVSGIALTAIYRQDMAGSAGISSRWGIKAAFSPLGVTIALTFIGLAVRRAHAAAGAGRTGRRGGRSRGQPGGQPLAGVLARDPAERAAGAADRVSHWPSPGHLGEYGSVVFISGNMPLKTEITSLLIITKLEQYDYAGATAIAVVDAGRVVRHSAGDQSLQWWTGRGYRKGVLSHDGPVPTASRNNRAAGSAHDPLWLRVVLVGTSRAFRRAVSGAAAGGRVHRGAPRRGGGLSDELPRPGRLAGHPADLLMTADRRAAEPGVRRRGRVGDRQVRVPGQEPADHADRPAVRRVAGHFGTDLRAAVRHARLARAVVGRGTTSRSSSPCRGSCWRRCS